MSLQLFISEEDHLEEHYFLFKLSCLFYTNRIYFHTFKLSNCLLHRHLHDSLKSIEVFELLMQKIAFQVGKMLSPMLKMFQVRNYI